MHRLRIPTLPTRSFNYLVFSLYFWKFRAGNPDSFILELTIDGTCPDVLDSARYLI